MFEFKAKINDSEIIRATKAHVYTTSEATIKKAARDMYDGARRRFFRNFDKHPITQELEYGKQNPTEDMTGPTQGYGNLYGLFGFDEGSDPTNELREFLQANIHYYQRGYQDGLWTFEISIPSETEIEQVTTVAHLGMSWVEAIEKGTTSIVYYVNKVGGRSGGGIQAHDEVDDTRVFAKTPYTSELFQKFQGAIIPDDSVSLEE